MTQEQRPDPGSYQGGQPPAGTPPPQSPAPPPSGQPPVGWAPTSRPEQVVPGAAGLVYADVPNRIIALIIDAILLGIITFVVTAVLYGIVGQPVTFNLNTGFGFNILPLLIGALVSLAISAAYYIYTWTSLRASPGMKALGMQVGNFPDGATLTQEQAIKRWAALWGLSSISQVVVVAPTIGALVGLLTLGYLIYLLWTTAQSPTKQGFHDKFANSVVVKAARNV
jgi:uncharacterized RDD family membrane protein YckC